MTSETDREIFNDCVESGLIETTYDAYLIGIGVGRTGEKIKHMIGK